MKYELEIPEGMEFDPDNSVIKFKPLPSKQTLEELFLSMWEGCEEKTDPEYPNSVFWFKDGKLMFEWDKKSNILWCNYTRIWRVLQAKNNWEYSETQSFIKLQVEKYFKMRDVTPALRVPYIVH